MFDLIIKEASNRFNLGNKALPLVQVLVSTMTNPETGGLTGFIERFKGNGLGYLIDSWTSGSAPLAINHAQIESVLGANNGLLGVINSKLGLDKGTALLGLAYLLPNLVNKLVPGGAIDTSLASAATLFAEKGGVQFDSSAPVKVINASAASVENDSTLDSIVKEVSNRFHLGDKALPLVQLVVAVMTTQATGGLNGFIQRFKHHGLERQVESWMQTFAPLSINHTQIEDVLGEKGGLLETITSKVGLDKGTSLLSLAYLLPTLFNKLVPGGQVSASLPSDVSTFAEKGFALLGLGSAAASIAASNASVSATPVQAPTPIPEPVKTTTPAPSQPVPTMSAPDRPVVTPITKKPVSHAPAAAAILESESEGGAWKYLLWLVPIAIGLWLLKSCSQSPEPPLTQTETATLPKLADSATLSKSLGAAPTPSVVPETAATAPGSATPSDITPPQEGVSKLAEDNNNLAVTPSATIADNVKDKSTPAADINTSNAVTDLPSTKLYFSVAKINLPADTAKKLAPILTYLKANKAAKVTISGFHDPTGNIAQNKKLAKNRAKQVYAKLLAAGIAKESILMSKPQTTTGTGNNAEARRVEVSVSK